MDRAFSCQEERVGTLEFQPQLKHFIPLNCHTTASSKNASHFSALKFRVPKSLKNLYHKAKVNNGFGSKRHQFDGIVVSNSAYCSSPCFLDEKMETSAEKLERMRGPMDEKVDFVGYGNEEEGRESCSGSEYLVSEATLNEEHSSTDSCSPPSMIWHIQENEIPHCENSHVHEEVEKPNLDKRKFEKQGSSLSGISSLCPCFVLLHTLSLALGLSF